MFVRITVFCLACFSYGVGSLAYGQGMTVDEAHISQVVEAHMANLDSWRSGDMLIRIKTSGSGRYFRLEDQAPKIPIVYVEGPDASSIVKEREQLYRVAFDLDKERCFVAINQRLESNVFDGLDNMSSPIVIDEKGAFLFSDPKRGILTLGSDGKLYQSLGPKNETVSAALFVSNAPDVRLLGWWPIGNRDCERLNNRLSEMAHNSISDIAHVGKRVYRATYHGVGVTEGEIYKYDWDLERNVPTRFWVGGEGQARFEGSAHWRLVDDQHVPESSRYVHGQIIKEGSRPYLVFHEVSVEVHWFSLNRELPDDLFNEAILRDPARIDELMNADVFEKRKVGDTHEEEKK